MSTWRTHYTPPPAPRRRRSWPILLTVLAVVLGPLLLAMAMHIAAAINAPAPATGTGCSQPTLLRAVDTL